ncbi:MAG: AgmX/PglI C-terminal domain-containing protein [Bdellovibrionota bacterium]
MKKLDATLSTLLCFTAAGCAHYNQETIRASVRNHKPQLEACVTSNLTPSSPAKDTLTLTWEIDESGTVKQLTAIEEKSTLTNEPLKKCFMDVIGAIKFEIPPSGKITTIDSYPFYIYKDRQKNKSAE